MRVTTIKEFDERTGSETRRRVAALEPDGYTPAGAAIRHASAHAVTAPSHAPGARRTLSTGGGDLRI